MFNKSMLGRPLRVLVSVMVLSAILFTSVPQSSRAQPLPPEDEEGYATNGVQQIAAPPEVGVEWITDWPGTADDRINWYYSANNLYNELRNAGWTGKFNYGNTSAWERDFKRMDLGGLNNNIIDSVDLAMIGTHGSSAWDSYYGRTLSSVYFSSNNHDWHLSPGDARRALGDTDLEWVAFDSCSVLRDDSMWYWYQAFNGLHLMLGFANTMYVVYPGDGGEWGNWMRTKGWWIFGHGARTVTQAWFTAVEDQQPSGVRARVLAETLDSYNDYIHGEGYVSPDYSNNGYYWYWDHVSGTPDPVPLAVSAPPTMPVYLVQHRTVDETYVEDIGAAFGLTGTVLPAPDGSAFYMAGGMSDTLQLRVDALTGGYLFQNLGELWTDPARPRNLPPQTRVQDTVEQWMGGAGEGLPGIWNFDWQITPTLQAEGPTDGVGPNVIQAPTEPTTPTNYALHYARTLDIGGQKVSVVGPGSRQNFYVGDNNGIIGLKGGWRDVMPAPSINAPGAASVPIKSSGDAWADFMADPLIALAQPPQALIYETAGNPEPTLGYYEQPHTISQTALIPVWIFVADLYTETTVPTGVGVTAVVSTLVASDVNLYIPAESAVDATLSVTITSPTSGVLLDVGGTVALDGMVSGGTPPYQYQWFSSVDGMLGTALSQTSPPLHTDFDKSPVKANQLTLFVSDANGMHAATTVDVWVKLPIYVPVVMR